jgi:hypothetical protein
MNFANIRGVRTSAKNANRNLPGFVNHPSRRSLPVQTTAHPLDLRAPAGSAFPRGSTVPRGQAAFRPMTSYGMHRELQTNSHIALVAQSFSTINRPRGSRGPVETQVGWNSRTGRVVIAQNDRQSAQRLLQGLRNGQVHQHAANLVNTPTPPGNTLAHEAGNAAKKLWRASQQAPTNADERRRSRMLAALWNGNIDVVTSGKSPHAERQIAPLVPRARREHISGTKLRCATCALAMGTHSATQRGRPVTGSVFPGTADTHSAYRTRTGRGRTLVGSIEQTTQGVTRARSRSPHL